MRHFLLRILVNALALYLIAVLVPGVGFRGGWESYLLAGFIFALINALIKPILKLISFPLVALTFGLFTIVINMAMLWLLVQIISNLVIIGLWSYFWATIIISILNFLVNPLMKRKPKLEHA